MKQIRVPVRASPSQIRPPWASTIVRAIAVSNLRPLACEIQWEEAEKAQETALANQIRLASRLRRFEERLWAFVGQAWMLVCATVVILEATLQPSVLQVHEAAM